MGVGRDELIAAVHPGSNFERAAGARRDPSVGNSRATKGPLIVHKLPYTGTI